MAMKILVVGGGGREHAIVRALACNPETVIFSVMAKKNPGIAALSYGFRLCRETDLPRIVAYARESGAEYAFIGPEAPLEAGVVDQLEAIGIHCVGPTRAAARIETDKAFCRDMMELHNIDGCPKYRVFHNRSDAIAFIRDNEGDLAIKPIGLTGGKGVRIMGEQVDRDGAVAYVKSLAGGLCSRSGLSGRSSRSRHLLTATTSSPCPWFRTTNVRSRVTSGQTPGAWVPIRCPIISSRLCPGRTLKKHSLS
jgi:phosphoribosylamine--glycine ligase